MRRTRLLAFLVIGFTCLIAQAGARADDDADKSWFVQWVESKISTPDRKISLGRIDGTLSSDVKIDRITIADRQGVWLTIDGAHLVWTRTALLRGVLDINRLEATSITVARLPLSSKVPDAMASEPITVPDLPVSVVLSALEVPAIHLAAPVVGSDMTFKVSANARLDGEGLKAHVAAVRADDPTSHVTFDADYAAEKKTLALDFDYGEPKGGVLAHSLNLPGEPALGLTLKGNGPLDRFRADLALSADRRLLLAGATTISRDSDAYRLVSDLSGSLESLAHGAGTDYFKGQSHLGLEAMRHDDGSIDLAHFDLVGGVLRLTANGHLAKDGFPTKLALDGTLSNAGAPVRLPSSDATIEAGALSLAFGDGRWTARAEATGLAGVPVTSKAISFVANGQANDLGDSVRRAVTFDLSGTAKGLDAADAGLKQAVAGDATVRLAGRWQAHQPVDLSQLHAELGSETIDGRATVDGATINGTIRLASAGLQRYALLAGQPLGGSADLDLSGTFAALTGAFDVTLKGDAVGLLASGQLAPLLKNHTTLAGRVIRDTTGTKVSGLRIGNDQIRLALDGALDKTAIDVTASAGLADVGVLTERAKGAVSAEATLKGPIDQVRIAAGLKAATVRINSHKLDAASVTLTGIAVGIGGIDRFKGSIAIGGKLDGTPINGTAGLSYTPDGRKSIEGLTFALKRTTVAGDMALLSSGLAEGHIIAHVPELAEIAPLLLINGRGSVDADVALDAGGGQQNGRVKLTASSLVVEGTSIARVDADVSASDLFGVPAAVGRANVRAVKAGGLDVNDATLSFSRMTAPGTRFALDARLATGPARIAGSVVAASGGFDVAIDEAKTTYQGQSFGLRRPAHLVKRGDRIEISPAEISLPPSGSLTIAGSVPLGAGDIRLTAKGNGSLALLNPFLRERGVRADGRVDVDIDVSGRTAAPVARGRVSVSGGSVADPETGMRLSGLTARFALDGDRVRIEQASATTGKGGTISAAGQITVAGNLDADITVRLARAEVSAPPLAMAILDGSVSVRGLLLTKPSVGGTVTIERSEITIPERFSANVAALNVKLVGAPAKVKHTEALAFSKTGKGRAKHAAAFDASLDVTIDVPSKMFVRGRGVDAELGGRVRLTGTTTNPQPTGAFTLRRGSLDVAGKHVQFDSGSVTLLGDLDPLLDFKLSSTANSITVTVAITGNASDPALVLSSTPDLPQDEILSQFLFGHNVAELSGTQMIQLAGAAAQLAGGSSGGGLLSAIRTSTGLDSFGTTTDKNGNVALQAGRYISDRIYFGVVTSDKGTTDATLNINVTKNLKVQLQGGQTENKGGLIFQKEY